MPQWNRRSVLAAGAALSTAGLLGPTGSAAAGDGEATASFAAGHPEGWSSYRGNPANSRYLPKESGFEKPDTIAWRSDHTGEVAVVDGTVYVQTDGEIHALDAADGTLEWEVDADATSTPAVADGTLFVTGDDHLTALDTADGSLEWDLAFETEASIPDPTVAFETVYLVVNGTLYAFDAADGSVRWELETMDVRPNTPWDVSDALMPTSFRPDTVAVANGTVYAALEGRRFDGFEYDLDCVFGAIDAMTGDRLWGFAVDPPHAGPPLTEPITATEHRVNANLGGGEGEYMFDAETGASYYRERFVAAGTETTYVTNHWDASRMLVVDDQESRDGGWTVKSDWDAWRAPLVVGETVIADHIISSDPHNRYDYPPNSLVGFDLADGTERWVCDLDEYLPNTTYPIDNLYPALTAADENTLYIQTTDELVALRASETDPDDGDDPADEDAPSDEDGPADGDDSDDGTDDGSDDDPDCECEDENDDAESDSEDDDGDDGDGDTGNDDDRNGDGGTDGDKTDDGSDDETGDGSDDGSDGDGRNEDDSSNDDDDTESDDSSTGGDDDSDGDEPVGNESDDENDSTEDDESDDGMPGFTTGAGIVGGAATLEWLRRTADVTDSDGVDESTE